MELLLKHNAPHQVRTDHGSTPLHAASARGHLDIVSLLISQGADLEATNDNGATPLFDAVEGGHLAVSL